MGINEKEFYRRSVWDKILDHKKALVVIPLLFLILATLYLMTAEKRYTTDAIVEVTPKSNQLGAIAKMENGENVFLRHLRTQIDFLQSRSLVAKTVEILHANIHYFRKEKFGYRRVAKALPYRVTYLKIKDPAFYGTTFSIRAVDRKHYALTLIPKKSFWQHKRPKKLLYTFGKLLKSDYFDIAIERENVRKEGEELYFKVYEPERYVEKVLDSLQVMQNSENSSMIRIVYSDSNPYSAKRFLDTLLEVFLDISIGNEISDAKDLLKVISAKLKEEKRKLDDAQKVLKAYIQKNRVAGLENQTQSIIQTLYQYELKKEALKLKEEKIRTLVRIYEKTGDYRDIVSLASDVGNGGIVHLLETIAADDARYKTLRLKYREKHPDVRKLRESIRRKLRALDQNLRELLRTTQLQIEEMQHYIDKYQNSLGSIPQKEFGYTQLRRKYDLLEKHYLFLLEKKTQMIISKKVQGSYEYRIIDYAYEPQHPSKPKKRVVLLLALLSGLLAALFYALIRDYFSRYIKAPGEVEELTTLPYLGTIPYIREKSLYNDLFVLKAPHAFASEMIWSLRTVIEDFVTPGEQEGVVIAVTSIIKGEGKTTIAANLALSLGLGEKKTVVVSMDTRLPELHLKFGLSNAHGIASVLFGEKRLDEVTFRSGKFPSLYVVPAGEYDENPLEMINSNKIDQILQTLRKEYDYIVLDLPPVGVAAEAIFLMRKSDLVITVLKANYSEKSFVPYMEKLVQKHRFQKVGFVLNGVDPKYIKILTRRENLKYIRSHEYISGKRQRGSGWRILSRIKGLFGERRGNLHND